MFSPQIITVLLLILVLSPLILSYFVSARINYWSWFVIYFGPVLALCLTIYSFIFNYPLKSELNVVQIEGLTLGLHLDVLSGFVLSFVLTIGSVVLCFSYRYLETDINRKTFLSSLSYVLGSVSAMLLSNNFLQFFIFWVLTSFFLHKLLTHVPNDKEAISSAREKFWISRLGDFFLIIAIIIYYVEFQTFSFLKIYDFNSVNSFRLEILALFLVLGAITKSAQWPFHFWLPKTMNTPTPVSAIMHAGIINSGGYLLIRMNPVLNQTHYSLAFLAVIGAVTAFLGVMMMWTQTDIKKSLAYSTISQMGFMMLQIGVGAYGLALLHMMGHAFYKAYSFLTIGQSVDYGRLNRIYNFRNKSYNISLLFYGLIILCSATFYYLTLFSNKNLLDSKSLVLSGILFLTLLQTLNLSKNWIYGTLNCLFIFSLYTLLYFLSDYLFSSITYYESNVSDLYVYLNVILFTGFGLLFLIQRNLNHLSKSKIFNSLYVKMLNGI